MNHTLNRAEQRQLQAVRAELATIMGIKPPLVPKETPRLPLGREVVLFEGNTRSNREILRRTTLDEGEKFTPSSWAKNERRG